MLIVLNLNSNGGNGINKWRKVKTYLDQNNVKYKLLMTENYEQACQGIEQALKEGAVDTIVAAGGDGTVNGLLNFLFQSKQSLEHIKFGAIGLGSSNDFHKPFSEHLMIEGIPVILPSHSKNGYWDLGFAQFKNQDQNLQRYFAINSSLGLTANGNAFFNLDTPLLKLLKKIHVEVANAWTIFNVLLKFDNYLLKFEGIDLLSNKNIDTQIDCCNVGILKKTNVSGGMHYDTSVRVDDGRLDVAICEDMGRFDILKIVSNLYKGKFVGTKKTQVFQFESFKMSGNKLFNLEFDGEVFQATEVTYAVMKKALRLC